MSYLENYSAEELAKEIERRKTIKEQKPQPLGKYDLKALEKICAEALDSDDEDTDHYVYETAMETIYGKDVWKYINAVKE